MAIVASIAPRLDARCPPFSSTHSMRNSRISVQRDGISSEYGILIENGKFNITNKEEFEMLSQNSIKTIKRNVKKLIECDNKVIQVCKDKNGKIFYKINPYFNPNDKASMGNFIVIDSDMLRYLVNISNSDTIKIYCIFKWLLWDNENKKYISKRVDRPFLCDKLGLNPTYERNLQKVTDILQNLINNYYLTRKKEHILDKDGKYKTVYCYSICDYEYWRKEIKRK